ncbi:MAG: alpha-amylase family glycosyl hydrolase, partial [Verrucomicrobiota bacterium]
MHEVAQKPIRLEESSQQLLTLPGMGAIPHPEMGCTFRVWAPHAQKLSVVGDFNHWNSEANLCKQEENGVWATFISEAKPGDEYKFNLWVGEKELRKNDPYARLLTNSAGNSVIYQSKISWDADTFNPPPLHEWVIYEMHIGTFNRPAPDKIGTFESATQKLPYLQSLGINVVELMPTAEFPGGISWGYNTAHPFAVETDYGGPDELQKFIQAAHAHGIAVVMDVVYNHFGPSDLDLWQFDGWNENNLGGIYFYNDWKATTPWGETRPDYGRPEVRQYLRDNLLMWLDDYHLDGIRMDSICHIRNVDGNSCPPDRDIPEGWTLMQWMSEEAAKLEKNKILIAEDLKNLD